jgi:WhiB family redox-sensing transcriptional regulator
VTDQLAAQRLPDDSDLEREWTRFAACRFMPSEVFFLARAQDAQMARNVCATCPVRAPCLAHALSANEDQGVWGGYTVKEIRMLRRKLGLAAPEHANLRRAPE